MYTNVYAECVCGCSLSETCQVALVKIQMLLVSFCSSNDFLQFSRPHLRSGANYGLIKKFTMQKFKFRTGTNN